MLSILKNKEAFFAGLFDAEGNVSLYNRSFRWACKNENLVKIYSKFLSDMKLFDRYDGNCIICKKIVNFYEKIAPFLRHYSKINLTNFMINGYPLPSNYLLMSIDLKPNSLELGRNLLVLNLGSSRKPKNKPHLLRCGTHKVFLILKYLQNHANLTSKSIAKALKKNKIYSELKLLNKFGFISSSGYPSRFKINSKGLKELGAQ